MGRDSQAALLDEATRAIGADAGLIAAGLFTLQDMIWVGAVGGGLGGAVGANAAGGAATFAAGALESAAAPMGAGLGAGIGLYEAKHGFADQHGMTVQLILAVSVDTIYVLNRDTDDRLPGTVTTFDRTTCRVTAHTVGPSRFLHLRDPETGHEIKVGGTLMSKPDHTVMHVLMG